MIQLLAAAPLLAIATQLPVSKAAIIGISPNVKVGGTINDLVQDLKDLRVGGLRFQYVSVKWSELEAEKGKIDVKKIDDAVNGLGGLGFDLAITIQTLDTNNRTLPADLMDKSFDSPEMRSRWDALLRAVVPRFSAKVRWVMLGNEVDVYLAEHAAELEKYAGFVERGRQLVRELKPGLPVGVTCTFGGTQGRMDHFRRLNRETDIVAMTYYALKPDFAVQPVSVVPGDVAKMVEMAGTKPLFIQEAGYPADLLLGSSENQQAEFVDALFDAVKAHPGRIAAANYFLLVDFNDQLVETFLKYYRVPNAKFRAYLATIGLRKADGTARKSYATFLRRLKAWDQSPGAAQ
jgi:hypothetical protein